MGTSLVTTDTPLVRIGRGSTGDDRHVKGRIHALVVAQRETPGPGAGVVPHLRVPQARRRDRRQDRRSHRRQTLTRGGLQLGRSHRSLEPREVRVEEVAPAVADVRGVEDAVPAVDHVVVERDDHGGGIGGYASGPARVCRVGLTLGFSNRIP